MDVNQIKKTTDDKMKKSVDALKADLAKVRTGRAHTGNLDHIKIDYYGTETPLNQVATLSMPEPSLIVTQPWDPSVIDAIEKAILKADLGLNPGNDGKIVRIPIPALTEERRKQLAKKVHGLGEDAKTAIRQVRRDANEAIKKLEKDGDVSQDDSRRALEEIQKKTDKYCADVDTLVRNKEKEILEV